jgi:hypothetical protein
MNTSRPLTVSLPMGLFSAASLSYTQSVSLKSRVKPKTEAPALYNDGVLSTALGLPEMEVWDDAMEEFDKE